MLVYVFNWLVFGLFNFLLGLHPCRSYFYLLLRKGVGVSFFFDWSAQPSTPAQSNRRYPTV